MFDMKFTNVNTNLYKSFLAVYEERNITVAAEKSNKTQPTLTYDIKVLEEQIGAKLFYTHPRGVNPTKEAHALYEKVKPSFDLLREAELSMRDFSNMEDSINIGYTSFFSGIMLINYINNFKKKFPNVNFNVLKFDLMEGIEKLKKFEIDILLVIEDGFEKMRTGLANVPVEYLRQSFYCNEEFAKKNEITPIISEEKFATLPLVGRPKLYRLGKLLSRKGMDKESSLIVDQSGISVHYVQKGLGAGVFHETFIEKVHSDKKLVKFNVENVEFPMLRLEFVYPHRGIARIPNEFIKSVKEYFKTNIWAWSLD